MSKIKISLTKYDLDRIREAALTLFKDKHNVELSPDQYVVACHIQAFVDYLQKHGGNIDVTFPVQKVYEVVDEY
jgi:hypothetical protein